MNHNVYIGIDNGVSGSLGFVGDIEEPIYEQTPVKLEQSYTKKKQNINRLDTSAFKNQVGMVTHIYNFNKLALLERPMVNSMRFNASLSAIRCLEAQLICLEWMDIPYIYVDSKEWQKELLPKGIKGSKDLKKASADIGKRLFPMLSDEINKQGDADGLLIAEWARRKNL